MSAKKQIKHHHSDSPVKLKDVQSDRREVDQEHEDAWQ